MTKTSLRSAAVGCVVALAVFWVAAGSVVAQSSTPANLAQKADLKKAEPTSPMVFYLAKGEADACGPGCNEWIAADGHIDAGAPERLRAFFKQQPNVKRPIYFHSPGGLVAEALVVGRILRERGLTAGVARTTPEECPPRLVSQEGCDAIKRSGRELKAALSSVTSQCSSACVFAFVGARIREVAPEALLGVHASKTIILSKFSKAAHVPPGLLASFHKENRRKVARYLTEMGVQPALLEAAEKIPNEFVKYLSREEIAQFGIDTRAFVESPWVFNEGIPGHVGVEKSMSERLPGGVGYHTTTLRLVCLWAGQILVGYSRSLNTNKSQNLVLLKVSAGGKDFRLDPPRTPLVSGEENTLRDQRQQWVPARFFESAAADDHMVLTEGMLNRHTTNISTTGLTAALAALHCGYPSPAPGDRTALTPNQ